MAPTLAELMQALPDDVEQARDEEEGAVLDPRSLRAVPLGRFHRLRLLGTLQAQVTAGYLFHWVRGWFRSAEENKRRLAETHWRSALRVLDSMSYLRGA